MNLRPIIDDLAGQADDLLADVKDRAAARSTLDEFLALEHPRLNAADRRTVLEHTMGILESEDFFSERYVDSFDADQNTESTGDED